MAQHGHFAWNELNTHDVEASKRFYGAAYGWTFDAMPMGEAGTYWVAKAGDAFAAGLFAMTDARFENVPDHWLPYLEVDDIDRRAENVTTQGGTILRAPWTVPGVGRIAIVRAPGGAVMGMMTSATAA